MSITYFIWWKARCNKFVSCCRNGNLLSQICYMYCLKWLHRDESQDTTYHTTTTWPSWWCHYHCPRFSHTMDRSTSWCWTMFASLALTLIAIFYLSSQTIKSIYIWQNALSPHSFPTFHIILQNLHQGKSLLVEHSCQPNFKAWKLEGKWLIVPDIPCQTSTLKRVNNHLNVLLFFSFLLITTFQGHSYHCYILPSPLF